MNGIPFITKFTKKIRDEEEYLHSVIPLESDVLGRSNLIFLSIATAFTICSMAPRDASTSFS